MILTAFGFLRVAGAEASSPLACSCLLFVPAPLGAVMALGALRATLEVF